MNSDRDNIPPVLTQIIPAGHCMCATSTTFNCSGCLESSGQVELNSSSSAWKFQPDRDGHNVGLDGEKCQATFPGLYEDINRAARFWNASGISAKDLEAIRLHNGMVRARIRNGELYVIKARGRKEDHRRKIIAVLSSIHRALSANPGPANWNFDFVFSVEDRVQDIDGRGHPIWVHGRKASEESVWLMPDPGFWAWENLSNSIGPYDEVVKRIENMEVDWPSKTPKLVWRGKMSFAPKLRRGLLEAARAQPWGDVKELVWARKTNFLTMEDHCNYMFIAHVEGRAFSSSLKYRQACRSVIVSHKLQYIQHHHYLLQATGPRQNYVEVERDFSDLNTKMEALLKDQDLAKKIADNSVTTFKERYLTKAAEACYWRAMWNSWANVSTSTLGKEKGLRYESFILLESSSMSEIEW
ncbi:hypothetical protein FQN57_005972 [Myotisia sp. PD_48]|nr:hypothetical protein FQN57_005972 [Myotisia sp. PD_48]